MTEPLYPSNLLLITNTMLNIGQVILEFLSTLSTLLEVVVHVHVPLLKGSTFKRHSNNGQAILETLSTLSTPVEILTFINNSSFSCDALEFHSERNLGTLSRFEIEIELKTVE
jgi:hypothetical protein